MKGFATFLAFLAVVLICLLVLRFAGWLASYRMVAGSPVFNVTIHNPPQDHSALRSCTYLNPALTTCAVLASREAH